jgi:uncharacterized membrane protein (UPF0127 family)
MPVAPDLDRHRPQVLGAALVALVLAVVAAITNPGGAHPAKAATARGPVPEVTVRSASNTAPPAPAARPPGVQRSRVAGFDQTGFTVTAAGGRRSYCGLLALTRAQQNQGLMGRHDLAGYDAMLFAWPTLTRTFFYMRDTLIPLSIAWFGAGGDYLFATDMSPCPPSAAQCPLYGPGVAYQYAVEVPQGRLGSLGIGPGSTLHVGGGCR